LDRNLPRYQFAPRWGRGDLLSPTRTRGLSLGDFFVARRSDAMVGCLAIWDQGEFKQAVVRGYSRRLAVTRPLVNALAPLLRIPRLPAPGRTIRNAFLSHVAIDEDDPAVLLALLAAAYDDATKRSIDYLTIAFAGRNPLARVVKKAFPHREYPSMLYLVHWEDGAGAASEVDGRIPHLEAALL
jgi:hypothetical protein